MSTRHVFALLVALCTIGQVGCTCLRNCGRGFDSCCASCGVVDAACGCPEASCCCPEPGCACPEASCCCPEPGCACPDSCCDTCCDSVGCGSCVSGNSCPLGNCRLLQRMRNALCGCQSGCSGRPYYNEWQDSPPCQCNSCDCYGNYTGGPYGSPHGRRANLAKRHSQELYFSEEEAGTTYR